MERSPVPAAASYPPGPYFIRTASFCDYCTPFPTFNREDPEATIEAARNWAVINHIGARVPAADGTVIFRYNE